MRRLSPALLSCVLLFSLAAADDYGGYAGAPLEISLSPRATAMGNAYTAVSDDVYGLFVNPGAAAQLQRLSFGGAYRDMSHDRSLQQLAVLIPVRGEAAIGFSGQMATMGKIIGRTPGGVPTEELDNLDAVLSLTFSRRFSRFLTLGGDVRYYYKKLENTTSYSAGFDVGGMVHLERESTLPEDGFLDLLRFGAVVRNLAAKYPWNTGDYWNQQGKLGTSVTDNVPFIIKAGFSALFYERKALLAVDVEKHEKRSLKINAGAEYRVAHPLALRAGLAGGKPAVGVGFYVPIKEMEVRIDLAVQEEQNLGGWETIVGLTFTQ